MTHYYNIPNKYLAAGLVAIVLVCAAAYASTSITSFKATSSGMESTTTTTTLPNGTEILTVYSTTVSTGTIVSGIEYLQPFVNMTIEVIAGMTTTLYVTTAFTMYTTTSSTITTTITNATTITYTQETTTT